MDVLSTSMDVGGMVNRHMLWLDIFFTSMKQHYGLTENKVSQGSKYELRFRKNLNLDWVHGLILFRHNDNAHVIHGHED